MKQNIEEIVEQRLQEAQSNKEFKDIGRVSNLKKTKSAYRLIDMSNLSEIEMDEVQAFNIVKKDLVWQPINISDERNKGVTSGATWLKVKIREAVPTKPENSKQKRVAYVMFLNKLQSELLECYNVKQIEDLGIKLKKLPLIDIITYLIDPTYLDKSEEDKKAIEEIIKKDYKLSMIYSLERLMQNLIEEIFSKRFCNILFNKGDSSYSTYAEAKEKEPITQEQSDILIANLEKRKEMFIISNRNFQEEYINYTVEQLKNAMNTKWQINPISKQAYKEDIEKFRTWVIDYYEIKIKRGIAEFDTKIENSKPKDNDWSWSEDKKEKSEKKSNENKLIINKKEPLAYIKRTGGYKIGDISVGELIDKFGYKAVNYGNYVDDKWSKQHTKFYLQAMSDLGEIFNINIKELNQLGGLSIVFGGKGRAGHLATYFPQTKDINLTKSNGDGSVAHEYGHYFDNLMVDLDKKKAEPLLATENLNRIEQYEVRMALKDIVDFFVKGNPLYTPKMKVTFFAQDSNTIPNIPYLKDRRWEYKKLELKPTIEETLEQCEEILVFDENLYQTQVRVIGYIINHFQLLEYSIDIRLKTSMFYQKSAYNFFSYCYKKPSKYNPNRIEIVKAGDKRTPYWTSNVEMFARAWETILFKKILDKNRRSDYLVSGIDMTELNVEGFQNPYPSGSELNYLEELYDNLIKAVKKAFNLSDFIPYNLDREDILVEFESKTKSEIKVGIDVTKGKEEEVVEYIEENNVVETIKESILEPQNEMKENASNDDVTEDVDTIAKALEGKDLSNIPRKAKGYEDTTEGTVGYGQREQRVKTKQFKVVIDGYGSLTSQHFIEKLISAGRLGEEFLNKKRDKFTDGFYNEQFNKNIDLFERQFEGTKEIAEAYHEAKADGSNPELVNAVENAIYETPKADSDTIINTKNEDINEQTIKTQNIMKPMQIEKKQDDWIDKVPSNEKYSKKVKSIAYKLEPTDKNLLKIVEPFASKDPLRQEMSAMLFDENGITCTNSNTLIHLEAKNLQYQGLFIGDKNKKLFGDVKAEQLNLSAYPKWKSIIRENVEDENLYDVDVLAIKTYCEIVERLKLSSPISKPIKFSFGNNNENIIAFNYELMIILCESLLLLGYEKCKMIVGRNNQYAMFIMNENFNLSMNPINQSFALIMPIYITNLEEYGNYDLDMDRGAEFIYSLTNDAIYSNKKYFHKIDTNITKAEASSSSSLDIKEVAKIKSKIRGNHIIDILGYCKIENGVLSITNLENTYQTKAVGYENGIYEILGESLKKINIEISDFPKIPSNVNIKLAEINRQELVYILDLAENFVSNDDLRPQMTGVNLSYKEGKMVIASTDAHKLFRYELSSFHSQEDFNIILPVEYFDFFRFFDCDNITIYRSEKYDNVLFDCDSRKIYFRNIDARYPLIDSVIPYETNNKIVISKKLLSELTSIKNPKDKEYQIQHCFYEDGTIKTFEVEIKKYGYRDKEVLQKNLVAEYNVDSIHLSDKYNKVNKSHIFLAMPLIMNHKEGEKVSLINFSNDILKSMSKLDQSIYEINFTESNRAGVVPIDVYSVAGIPKTPSQKIKEMEAKKTENIKEISIEEPISEEKQLVLDELNSINELMELVDGEDLERLIKEKQDIQQLLEIL
jgi:hypothetical protein